MVKFYAYHDMVHSTTQSVLLFSFKENNPGLYYQYLLSLWRAYWKQLGKSGYKQQQQQKPRQQSGLICIMHSFPKLPDLPPELIFFYEEYIDNAITFGIQLVLMFCLSFCHSLSGRFQSSWNIINLYFSFQVIYY